MNIDPTVLCALPYEQQDRFAHTAREIVKESFVLTGDRDYLTARFAFFENQSHLFLWSAAQALEKYLKANILLFGSGSIKRTHKHTELAKDLGDMRQELREIATSIPMGWAEQGVTLWPDINVDDFLRRIEELGSPDVRYDQVRLQVHLQDLVFLDRLAFCLRSKLIAEQVTECRLVGDAMKHCFLDLNYSFAPRNFEHRPLRGITLCNASVTTLEAAVNGCYGHAAVYIGWAKKSMQLNEKDIPKLLKSESTSHNDG